MGERLTQAVDRLASQFDDRLNLTDLLDAIISQFDECGNMLSDLLLLRTLELAEGVWLDQVGEIVGIKRPPVELEDLYIFTYKALGDPDVETKAYSTLTDDPRLGGHYQSLDGLPTGEAVGDTDYRTYIKAKAIAMFSKPTIRTIYTYIQNAFDIACQVYNDSDPGYVLVHLDEFLPAAQRRLLKKYAPIAAGIKIEIVNWPIEP